MNIGNLSALEAALAVIGQVEDGLRDDEFTTNMFAEKTGITRGAASSRLLSALRKGQIAARPVRLDGKRQTAYRLVLPADVKQGPKQNRGSTKRQTNG